MKDRIEHIKNCISKDELKTAIGLILDLVRETYPSMQNEAILLSRQFHGLDKKIRFNLLSNAESESSQNRIALSMLQFLDQLSQNPLINDKKGVPGINYIFIPTPRLSANR